MKRVIIARELGLAASILEKNPKHLLGVLAEEHAEALDQARETHDPRWGVTPFHPNGPIRLQPARDHDLGEYAKKLVVTDGAATPIPPGFVPLDPIGRERRQLMARVRGIRPPFEPAFDPDRLQDFLERDQMQRQYIVNHAVVYGNLIQDAERIIRSADANQANIALWSARRPDRQQNRRKRVKEMASRLAQLPERERGRQGVPSPGPALAERAKDVAGVILGEWMFRPGVSIR
jgi:hypothetical protein